MHPLELIFVAERTGGADLLRRNGIAITDSSLAFSTLSTLYGVAQEEICWIDFNRLGVHLPNNEVRVGFRARFIAHVGDGDSSKSAWFAVPVRAGNDTPYTVHSGQLWFNDQPLASTHEIELDTCDVSYQRGPNLLNLNSRSRSNCAGCRACIHNYKNFYDQTVIRDQERLVTEEQIGRFFVRKEQEGLDMSSLKQIAVVTGLFGNERNVVEHMRRIHRVVEPKGFQGELLYFGCEVNSEEGLRQLADLGRVALVYAVDTFSNRGKLLNPKKAKLTLEDARLTLEFAKSLGIETTFAYVAGIDSLDELAEGFAYLSNAITRFPVVNVFQVQTQG